MPEKKAGLSHLAGFLKKEEAPAKVAEGAAEAAAATAIFAAGQRTGPFVIPDPIFEDHDSAEFNCDGCAKMMVRTEFTEEQLMKLSDCKEERAKRAQENAARGRFHVKKNGGEEEGPWKAMLVRLHANGFGFMYNPELYARHNRDVYLSSTKVQHFMGGATAVKDVMEDRGWVEGDFGKSKQNFCRVQFLLEITPEGKLMAKDSHKIELICKMCERRRAARAKREQDNLAQVAAAVKQSGIGGAPSLARPAVKGFDPQAKLTNVIGSLRAKLGLPQPGAAGALPVPQIPGMVLGQASGKQFSATNTDILKKAEVALMHGQKKAAPPPRPALMAGPASRPVARDPFS